METDSYSLFSTILTNNFEYLDIIYFVVFVLLLICSGLISGSEVAYFSLTPSQVDKLKQQGSERIVSLLKRPNRLLATILISNNFVNVGIVILSSFIIDKLFDFSLHPTLGFVIQVVVVTFFILLFGEIIPKIYANKAQEKVVHFMATPLTALNWIFRPFSRILIKSSSIIGKRMSQKNDISIDQLSKALELTEDSEINEEKDILEGIVRFTNINVGDILQPRINIVGVDNESTFDQVKNIVVENSYSRMPVFQQNLDSIIGVLYIKDLLPHLSEDSTFNWHQLVRPAYFVPEVKKINDLLEEFRAKKVHLAVVVDEYGGTSGIVTMEDIIEEIIGEIDDEYDEKQDFFSKTQDGAYIFQASTLLNDFAKVVDIDLNTLSDIEGEAETLAGLILEIVGELPKKGNIITFQNYKFTILDVDTRRIKKVKFEILPASSVNPQ